MKILVLDGFPAGQGTVVQKVMRKSLSGHDLEYVELTREDIAWCRGCFNCWLITPGECAIQDAGQTIAHKFMNSDVVVLLTPITFGSYSSDLKKALDRLIPNISGLFTKHRGETHHVKRYRRYPALITVGVQEQEDMTAAEIFRELAGRNSLNLYPEAWACQTIATGDPVEIQAAVKEVLNKAGVAI